MNYKEQDNFRKIKFYLNSKYRIYITSIWESETSGMYNVYVTTSNSGIRPNYVHHTYSNNRKYKLKVKSKYLNNINRGCDFANDIVNQLSKVLNSSLVVENNTIVYGMLSKDEIVTENNSSMLKPLRTSLRAKSKTIMSTQTYPINGKVKSLTDYDNEILKLMRESRGLYKNHTPKYIAFGYTALATILTVIGVIL